MFVNGYGDPLGASGVRFKLAAYVAAAARTVLTLGSKKVTPHSFRHATAVHLVSAGVDITVIRSWLGHVSLDTTNHYAQANLDGDKYLTYQQVSPYVSRQFGDAVFLRGAYAYTDKTFKGRADRDAKSNALQADAYFFLDGVNRYITVGVKGTKEDATGPEFDYKSGTYKAE